MRRMGIGICRRSAAIGLAFAGLCIGGVPANGADLSGATPLDRTLIVPDAGLLMSGQQQAAEAARRANPEVQAAIDKSATAYEGLPWRATEKLTGEAFPGTIHQPAGGPPKLAPGVQITRFISDNAASLILPGGKHGVLDSATPIAVMTSTGRVPIDLNLTDVGNAFEAATPSAGARVRMPSHLGEGVALSDLEVSLTPVASVHGPALEGTEGVVDGATVFYGESEDAKAGVRDLSTIAKPVGGGVEIFSDLLSQRSPQKLYFRVGLPAGATLEQDAGGSVQVMAAGRSIATIVAPVARDAEGTTVPVSLELSGHTIVLGVSHRVGQYRMPLLVDPLAIANDENLTGASLTTNWHFCTSRSANCAHEEGPFRSTGWGGSRGLVAESSGTYKAGEFAEFIYKTQGESKIIEGTTTTEANNNENPGSNVETSIQIANENGGVNSVHLFSASKNYGPVTYQLGQCSNCSPANENHDSLRYMMAATAEGSHFRNFMSSASVEISQNVPLNITLDTTDQYLLGGKWANILYGSGSWMSEHQGALGFTVTDAGIGISRVGMKPGSENLFEENLLTSNKCAGVQCPETVKEELTYNSKMPDGEYPVSVEGENAGGGWNIIPDFNLRVDTTAPTALQLTGLPAGNVVDQSVTLTGEATDGTATTRSSGISSLELAVDGFSLPIGKAGSCEPGPCGATAEWTLNGEEFGAGKHTLELLATDHAGNKETRSYEFTIRHADPMEVGPASVNPITGGTTVQAKDVSIGGGYGTLGVARSFNSRQPAAGEGGVLGPQWSLSLSGEQGLESEPTGDVTLVAEDGTQVTFANDGKGGYISPKGDANLALSAELEGTTVKAYLLKNPSKGTTLRFIHPAGASESNPWVIEKAEGALSQENGEALTYKWEVLEGVERPKEALAPAPPGVSCEPEPPVLTELKKGCRALSFTYGTANKAGEIPSEWGEFKGRLSKVSFTAYDPIGKAMKTIVVAEYAYDKSGRLRTEWDPRISPALKTMYGYDTGVTQGRLNAINPAGREPLLLHYGTTASDPSAGRLLSVIRPPASAALPGNTRAPEVSVVPTLSTTTPVIGTTLSVATNGTWINSPVAYTYEWQHCNSGGGSCKSIPGAVNESYTPQASDAGYTLRVGVIAMSGIGSKPAYSATSSVIALTAPAYSLKSGSIGEGAGQLKNPTGAATDAAGNVWIVDHNNNRIDEFNSAGTFVKTFGFGVSNGEAKLQTCTSSCRAGIATGGNGGFFLPDGLAISGENIFVADSGNNRIEEFTTAGAYVRKFGSTGSQPAQLQNPVAVAVTKTGDVWIADRSNNRIDEFTEAGTYIGSFGTSGTEAGKLKEPSGIAFSGEYAYVVDAGNSRVQQFTLSGGYVAQFGSAGTGNGQFKAPAEIATEPVSGDLYVADSGNNRVEEFNPAGTFVSSVGTVGEGNGQFKGVEGVAVSQGGTLYAADLNNNRIEAFNPTYSTNNPVPAPPAAGSNAVSTIDYQVPVSGSGAPYQLGAGEIKTGWAQEDAPAFGTALFPSDEPMGWPANGYTKATVHYYDSLGRQVNVAAPSGGISTVEYNEANGATRTLSAAGRAEALKEGSKSAEVAKLLDTRNTYNAEGTELLEKLGPRHAVKLANGEEKQARIRVLNYYDEGAPGGEHFGLVTKRTEGAEYEGKEADVRTTAYSYNGQSGLGWIIRQPTAVTVDPNGLNLVTTTVYDPSTATVLEKRSPAAGPANGNTGSYAYTSKLTSAGREIYALASPCGTTIDSSGHLWITEDGNSQIYELSTTGEVLNQLGGKGLAGGRFEKPHGIAVDSQGNVWVADTGNNRIQELTSAGTVLHVVGKSGTGNGEFKKPTGIAIDAGGNVWVGDAGNNRVQELTSEGVFVRAFGTVGAGNGQFNTNVTGNEGMWITFDSSGNVWVTDSGNSRVQEFSATGVFMSKFGVSGVGAGELKFPQGIAFDSSGNVWIADTGKNTVQKFTTSGTFISLYNGVGLKSPQDIAMESSGYVWIADTADNKLQQITPIGGQVLTQLTQVETQPLSMRVPRGVAYDSSGDLWVTDWSTNKVYEFSSTGSLITHFGTTGTGNGQLKSPADIAADGKGNVWVVDQGNSRIEEFTTAGAFVRTVGTLGAGNGQLKEPAGIAIDASGNVWVGDSGNSRIEEFSSVGTFLRTVGSAGTGNGQFGTTGIWLAFDSSGHLWATDGGNNRVQEFSATGTYMTQFGSVGTGNGQFKHPSGLAIDSSGHIFVVDIENARVQEFSSAGAYMAQFGAAGSVEGQFALPTDIAVDGTGTLSVANSFDSRVDQFKVVAPNTHVSQTIYYSAAANPSYPACGEHAEWANLPCRSQPALQPTTGNPLPVVTDTYNLLDEPETVTEAFGATTTRTKKSIYDPAGRLIGSEETSNSGSLASLPTVTNGYDPTSGVMTKQSTTVAEKTQTITSVYNQLGQLTEYTDADGNKSTYSYDVDSRLAEIKDGKGTQVYAYDSTTGAMNKLLDTAAGTFTASYDVEGRLTSETYPNGMTDKYVYNEVGEATHSEYVKETHCTEACTWFSEGVAYSAHGQPLSRASTLATVAYTYDAAARLTQVQETPVGKGCTTRIYAYDSDSNRLSLTKREPDTEGKCATSGGVTESHTYDEVDRLSDAGTVYDAFGNVTTLSATDAEGHEIKSTYYVSNQTRSTVQNGKTITYGLDPDARSREIVSEEGATKTTSINHYPGPGDAVAWTSEGGEKYTRNVVGIDGALSATEQNGQTPILQMHDLQGDIVATAALSETETKILSSYNSTEFGVPTTSSPPRYSWLGAAGVMTEFSSGANGSSGAGYVPQLGRPLQTQVITPPGAAPNGSYISPYASTISQSDWQASASYAAEAPMREAARERIAREEAEAAAGEAESAQQLYEEEEGEWEEEPVFGKGSGGGGGPGYSLSWSEVEEATKAVIKAVESHLECDAFEVAGTAGGFMVAGPYGAAVGAITATGACGIVGINELNEYNAEHAQILEGDHWYAMMAWGKRRIHRECPKYGTRGPGDEVVWVWSKYRLHGKHHVKIVFT